LKKEKGGRWILWGEVRPRLSIQQDLSRRVSRRRIT
jgi:hypothetical protein